MAAFKNELFRALAGKTEKPDDKRPAPRVVELPGDAFADTWGGRPKLGKTVRVGLRLTSAADLQYFRTEASKRAVRTFPEDEARRVEAFHDAFCREALGRALCQPDDASLPFWDVQCDAVFVALTPAGVRLLCEEYEVLKAATDPLGVEVDDERLHALGELIAAGDVWAELPFERARKVRRLLSRAIAMIEGG
jgi:hypothetical protein